MECTIKRSNDGPYYILLVNGHFCGNFDSVKEAADEFDSICMESKQEEASA